MLGNDHAGMVIQPRDEHLLRELGVMRIIDRELTKVVADFHSTTRANARLLMLCKAGLLRRFFQGTSAGGKKAVYALSRKGARYLGVPFQGLRYRDDELLVANFFVNHRLAVNEVYCLAKYQPISVADAKFVRWVVFAEPIASGIPLIPDGYFEVSVPQGVVAAFLEADLGQETLKVWKGKVQNYLRYAVSGAFEKRFQQSRFRVLAVANTENRAEALRRTTRGLTDKIFWFSTFERIRRDGLWNRVWRRAADEDLKAFF